MKPIEILKVMDLAWKVRTTGKNFYPLFTGDSGIGKSEIVQLWVKNQIKRNKHFFFLDLRIAYLEAPDMVGFPTTVKASIMQNGEKKEICTTMHALPDFFPRDPNTEGLILFEEPNRGTTGIMNTMMQILTDRKVHTYELPKGVIIAGAINPDNAKYDVNSMDTALRNRFVEYEVEYDHRSFVEYLENVEAHSSVLSFVKSGIWVYKSPDAIGENGKYIAPRTIIQLDAAEKVGLQEDPTLHFITVSSILGKEVGKEYHNFIFNQSPVLFSDLLNNKKEAIKKLKKMSTGKNYRGDLIGVTVQSVIDNCTHEKLEDTKDKLGEKTVMDVASVIPADQASNLLTKFLEKFTLEEKTIKSTIDRLMNDYPELYKLLKTDIKL